MSKVELPYKPGTKGFLIAQRLLAGQSYDEIEEDMKVKKKTIWNVASQLRNKGFHVAASRDQPLGSSQVPSTSINAPLRELKEEVPPRSPSIPPPQMGIPQGSKELIGEGEKALEKELLVQATPIIRKVMLNPKVFLWYDYARTKLGFKGDIGDMCVDAIEDFFRSRGYQIKIVKEEAID